jgi:hypothetical protein
VIAAPARRGASLLARAEGKFGVRRRIRSDLDHGLAVEALAYLDNPAT